MYLRRAGRPNHTASSSPGPRSILLTDSAAAYPEDYRACVDVNREPSRIGGRDLLAGEDLQCSGLQSGREIHDTQLGDKPVRDCVETPRNDRGVKAEITLPVEFKLWSNREVKFENRATAMRNGKISDAFKPLGRHVYVAHIVK